MPATSTNTTIAREYLRVSLDKSGHERSNDEQHTANEAEAAEHGWTLSAPYSDVGSASRYAVKPRGNFDTLIKDLTANKFGANILLLWESSRGSRKVSEWLGLIELCEERGVKIHVTTHERTYDPANGHDRKTLIDDASDSEYESWKLSRRAKRANGHNASNGRPHGRTPFGYRRERWHEADPDTGKLRLHVKQIIEPDEAKIVRELFRRIGKGHSLKSITRDFERRSIVKRSGGPFTAQHLRKLATNPGYVGVRVHGPGRKGGNRERVKLTEHKADWPAIIDRKTWLAVRSIMDAPERLTTRPGRAKYLLSMIAKCDVCGGPLAATERRPGGGESRSREWQYQCNDLGHVRVNKAALDDLAEVAILEFLKIPANVERITHDDGDDEALAQVQVEVAEVQAELDDLGDQVGRGELSASLAARAEPAIQARLRAAKSRRDELQTPGALRGLITPGADVARRWAALDMPVKRQVARLLLVPEILGELRVKRSPTPGHRVDVIHRVRWARQ